jgi:hypothetical protein
MYREQYVAPVCTKYLLLVNLSIRKMRLAFAGICMAMAVACAEFAAQLVRDQRRFSFPISPRFPVFRPFPLPNSQLANLCVRVLATPMAFLAPAGLVMIESSLTLFVHVLSSEATVLISSASDSIPSGRLGP